MFRTVALLDHNIKREHIGITQNIQSTHNSHLCSRWGILKHFKQLVFKQVNIVLNLWKWLPWAYGQSCCCCCEWRHWQGQRLRDSTQLCPMRLQAPLVRRSAERACQHWHVGVLGAVRVGRWDCTSVATRAHSSSLCCDGAASHLPSPLNNIHILFTSLNWTVFSICKSQSPHSLTHLLTNSPTSRISIKLRAWTVEDWFVLAIFCFFKVLLWQIVKVKVFAN